MVGNLLAVAFRERVDVRAVLQQPVDVLHDLVAVPVQRLVVVLGEEPLVLPVEHCEVRRLDDDDIVARRDGGRERRRRLRRSTARSPPSPRERRTSARAGGRDLVDVERLEDADGGLPALGAHVVRVRVGVERDLPAGGPRRDPRAARDHRTTRRGTRARTRGARGGCRRRESAPSASERGAGLCDPVREGRERRPELRERVEVPEQAFLQVDAAGLFVR